MDYPLGAALVSLIALVWAWRRHRHVYTPEDLLTPPGQGDEDLTELPEVITRSRSVVRAYAPGLLEPEDPGPTVAEVVAAHRAQATTPGEVSAGGPEWLLPPVGPDGLDLAGLSGHDGGGVGLVGPGAADTARALIVAALAAGGAHDVRAWTHLVIPTALANRLLTPTPPTTPGSGPVRVDSPVPPDPSGPVGATVPVVVEGIDRAHLVTDLRAALEYVDQESVERRGILDSYGVTDRAALDDGDPFTEYPPSLILLTDPPEPGLAERLATLAARGGPVGISVVVLGQWASGTTLDISADGHVTRLHPPAGQDDQRADDEPPAPDAPGPAHPPVRVAVLDVDAARDALSVVREAHTGIPTPTSDRPNPGTRSGRDRFTTTMRGITPPEGPPTQRPAPAAAAASVPAAAPDDQSGPGEDRRIDDGVADHQVRVRVLGAPVIWDRDSTAVPRMRSGATELLVLLAVHRSGLPLREVKEALWPAATIKQADKRLSTEVAALRGAIRQVAGAPRAQPVINTDSHYHLDPDLVGVDLWEFTDTLRQATGPTASADPAGEQARRIEVLRRAVSLADGQVLADGRNYEWIAPAREHLRRLLLRAHLQLTDLLTRTSQHPEAARIAMAAVDLDPTNEDTTRTAMKALAAAGRRSEIPALLRRLRAALDELDLEPEQETTALAERLSQGPPGRRRSRP